MSIELSVIIPAYNEGAHIGDVVAEMAKVLDDSAIDYEVCVVNNGSTDNSKDVIEGVKNKNSRVAHIHLEQNCHYGGAILTGISSARGSIIAWVDADGQIDPHDIVLIYRSMLKEGYELGKGIRKVRPESFWRRLQSAAFNHAFTALFFSPYHDINAKPKLLTRAAVDKVKLQSRDFFLDSEFVLKALRHQIPIKEIETQWFNRRSGESRTSVLSSLAFIKNMLAYRIGLM